MKPPASRLVALWALFAFEPHFRPFQLPTLLYYTVQTRSALACQAILGLLIWIARNRPLGGKCRALIGCSGQAGPMLQPTSATAGTSCVRVGPMFQVSVSVNRRSVAPCWKSVSMETMETICETEGERKKGRVKAAGFAYARARCRRLRAPVVETMGKEGEEDLNRRLLQVTSRI